MTYAYSTDEEHFYAASGNTREDAVTEGIDSNDLDPGRTIWTGDVKRPPSTAFMPDGGDILETMQERAYDDHGEFAEDWLTSVNAEQMEELTEAVRQSIAAWVDKHGLNPNFFHVTDIQAHKVPAPEKTFAEKVAEGVAERLGWTMEEARNVVGDTSEYEAEHHAVSEAVDHIIDAMAASA